MWSYTWNNEGVEEDGFMLVSPADREVGMIDNKVDAEEIVAMLNEALAAREANRKP